MTRRRMPDPAQLPVLSHLQWLILDTTESYKGKTISATQLRSQLMSTWGGVGPRFYQAMRRLEAYGALTLRKQTFDVGGGEVTRTYYSLTTAGREAWREVIDFYRTRGV